MVLWHSSIALRLVDSEVSAGSAEKRHLHHYHILRRSEVSWHLSSSSADTRPRPAAMFYEGSLQEGISSAVGQQKLVFCFITNDNEESRRWQDEHLQDSSLKDLILKQAVALRLQAGSEEAGYLAQIFPLPQTPTIVIMKHGELKEYIAAGTSRDDFFRRVQSAFNATPAAAPAAEPSASATQLSSSPSTSAPAASESAAISSSPENERSETVRRVLAERAAKLQAAKDEAERRAKEERTQAKEKAKAEAEAGVDTDAARTHRQAELLRKKRQQESEERRRILKRIEDDKAERRERAAERQQMRLDTQRTGDVAAALVSAPETKLPSTTRIGEMTSIQVRLFDGSTMRTRLKTKAPFREVRQWVDENRTDGKLPYTFRQLLTPMPNRAIDETEEAKSLAELGLAPSSTLILIPVQHYASAYNAAPQGILAQIIAAIMGLFTWLLSLVGLGGRGQAAPTAAAGADTDAEMSAAQLEKDRRVRGFQNPNDQRRDYQLYNGNSLNFEPRPDEEDEAAQ
ncbi:ubx [Purpureocillium lavendulum]|uniref:UBX domain-containing protein 2 n=1 Tax=Purpureocillium lavendulum TaxID=1247861 RepID=A0AB34FZ38_9HYPO|nr:ubx [Purpureocillium lavendulum]